MIEAAILVYAPLTSQLPTLCFAKLLEMASIVWDFPVPPSPGMIIHSWFGLSPPNVCCRCWSTMSYARSWSSFNADRTFSNPICCMMDPSMDSTFVANNSWNGTTCGPSTTSCSGYISFISVSLAIQVSNSPCHLPRSFKLVSDATHTSLAGWISHVLDSSGRICLILTISTVSLLWATCYNFRQLRQLLTVVVSKVRSQMSLEECKSWICIVLLGLRVKVQVKRLSIKD